MKKGISPLVAAVILIATTMSLAGILSFWASNFVQTQLSQSENATNEAQCLGSQFRVYSGSYDNTTKSLTLILENQRLMEIKLNGIYLFYSNDVLKTANFNGTIAGNELKSFNTSGIDPGYLSGQVRSNCPQVIAEFSCSKNIRCS